MAVTVKFISHKGEVLSALDSALTSGMDMVGGAAEANAKGLTPVRTGALRASIWNRDAGKHSKEIGTNTIPYALYVELGTSKMHAQPYLRPAGENYADQYVAIIAAALGM